jgi:hypothetical protein
LSPLHATRGYVAGTYAVLATHSDALRRLLTQLTEWRRSRLCAKHLQRGLLCCLDRREHDPLPTERVSWFALS